MKIGYDKDFIGDGIVIPLPRLTAQISSLVTRTIENDPADYLDYVHYTVVMNKSTKQPIFTASNIDQSLFKQTNRKDNWKLDSRLTRNDQLSNDYYKLNDWDKGHMVMRSNTAWGNTKHEAQIADEESFYYTNAAFQHKNMNRDEWLGLEEDIVRKFSDDANNKLCIFTGPIHGNLDRHYVRSWHEAVRIPSGFFKIVCYKAKPTAEHQPMGVKAFAMFQDEEIIKDQQGRKSIVYKEYQITIGELQDLTGIDFGEQIFDANPLFYHDSEERRYLFNIGMIPERIPIDHVDNIIDHDEIRLNRDHYENRKVAIVSAMINPSGKDKGNEWITVLNCMSEQIDVTGWVICDSKNRMLELKGKIKPGETKKFEGKNMGKLLLANSGGSLRIVNQELKLVDYVRWSGDDVRTAGEGQALIFGYVI